jgi:hypothetical protein
MAGFQVATEACSLAKFARFELAGASFPVVGVSSHAGN